MDDGDADDECEDACRLLCGTICSSSLQVHSRWSRWHRLQIGFVSQHFTFLLRHVRQPVLVRGTGALIPIPGAIVESS